jgi:class 3 adenylate cyclase
MNTVRQERRLVTLLFSDLTNSTGIASGLEPEQFADLLEQIRVIAHRIIPAHGGDIVRMDGDGML